MWATAKARATTKAKPKQNAARGKRGAKADKPKKKMSGLTAAYTVLKATGEPMHVKAIVEAAAKRGLWKSNAATPHATLYAAMIRHRGRHHGQSLGTDAMKLAIPRAGTAFIWALAVGLLIGAAAPIGGGLFERSRRTHWLNTSTDVRHNDGCRYFETTKEGRPCRADEGVPCGLCGG